MINSLNIDNTSSSSSEDLIPLNPLNPMDLVVLEVYKATIRQRHSIANQAKFMDVGLQSQTDLIDRESKLNFANLSDFPTPVDVADDATPAERQKAADLAQETTIEMTREKNEMVSAQRTPITDMLGVEKTKSGIESSKMGEETDIAEQTLAEFTTVLQTGLQLAEKYSRM